MLVIFNNSYDKNIGILTSIVGTTLPIRPYIVVGNKIVFSNNHKFELAFRRFLKMLNQKLYGRYYHKYHNGITAVAVLEGEERPDRRLNILAAMKPRYRIATVEFERLVKECWSTSDWQRGEATAVEWRRGYPTTRNGKDWLDEALEFREEKPNTIEQWLV